MSLSLTRFLDTRFEIAWRKISLASEYHSRFTRITPCKAFGCNILRIINHISAGRIGNLLWSLEIWFLSEGKEGVREH
jgi:hypothetical protein